MDRNIIRKLEIGNKQPIAIKIDAFRDPQMFRISFPSDLVVYIDQRRPFNLISVSEER